MVCGLVYQYNSKGRRASCSSSTSFWCRRTLAVEPIYVQDRSGYFRVGGTGKRLCIVPAFRVIITIQSRLAPSESKYYTA